MKSAFLRPFHLAVPVIDIENTRSFYTNVLGCRAARESERWIDFDFFGHQLSAHVVDEAGAEIPVNPVDGEQVPVRHFGLVMDWEDWQMFRDNLQSSNFPFLIEPTIRFKGQAGEQATLFIQDPSGNALEFKAFRDGQNLFNKD